MISPTEGALLGLDATALMGLLAGGATVIGATSSMTLDQWFHKLALKLAGMTEEG